MNRLPPHASIGVFTPSFPAVSESAEAAARAEDFLTSQGFKIVHGKLWGRADAYRTGSPRERADEFNSLLRDPAVDVLMAVMGGFVTNGMLPYIDYELYARHPKPVVGMSDVTALLMALYARTGVTVYYGPNFVSGFARLSPYREIALESLKAVLNAEGTCTYPVPEFYSDDVIDWTQPLTEEKRLPNKLVTLCGGKVTGRLIGGNLCTLTAVLGTPYMPRLCKGDILFIEDTEEWAGGVERWLAQLKQSGVFDLIGGLIIGKCRHFEPEGTGKSYYDLIYDYLDRPDIPTLAEFDLSHCAPMLTIPIGAQAQLDAAAQTLRLL